MSDTQSHPTELEIALDPASAVPAIWSCKIGAIPRGLLDPGSDQPMRRAVAAAYEALTGIAPDFTFSGWGAELTEGERAVVDGREPDVAALEEEALAKLSSLPTRSSLRRCAAVAGLISDGTPPGEVPEAHADEDGEHWWLQGHVEPAMAVLAVVVEQMSNVGADEARDLLIGTDVVEARAAAFELVNLVKRHWMKPDPTNEDRMIFVDRSDPEAEPWTSVSA